MIRLTDAPIDAAATIDSVRSPGAGAVVLFLGTVRQWTARRETEWLEYESYAKMAEKCLAELETEARARWPLTEVAVVHRLGRLEVGEASVAVAVSSAHRREAFEAAEWIIDRTKEVAPIWKKEQYADGASEWVHPKP
jgi:molybdopterin synthase catalytic subunit